MQKELTNLLFSNGERYTLLFEVIVVHFDGEDDGAAGEGNKVGERHVVIRADEPLHHEAEASHSHHDEAWQRDAIGVASADGLKGLWQIAQDQAKTAHPTADVE